MKILWFPQAEHELERAAAYIALRDPRAAAKVEHRLRTAVEHLRAFPRAGRPARVAGTREVVIVEYPFLIRYRVVGDQVQILRIFHASTNWAEG